MFNDIMADTSKLYEILNYYGLKTNIEESKKWIKKYVADALTGITTDLMTNVTYNELVSLRGNNNLKPGMLYRMTDYVTKVYSDDESISSAEHPFDLILFANTKNSLNENAFACLNNNSDGYFNECNINAWELKYRLDNDDSTFAFALTNKITEIYTDDDLWFKYAGKRVNAEDNTQMLYLWYNENFDAEGEGIEGYLFTYNRNPEINSNARRLNSLNNETAIIHDTDYSILQDVNQNQEVGKGVVYYLKDEWNNEAPFDFKNILQKDEEYTFGKGLMDFSLNGNEHGIYGNKINVYINKNDKLQYINRIRITEENCFNNNIKPCCQNSYIDFPVSECDISMNDDGELVVFKIQDFVSGIENKPIEHNYRNDYLTFEAVNDNTEIIFKESTNNPDGIKTIEVSKDKINWETKTSSYEGTILATLNAGECLYLKGNNSCYSYFDDDWGDNVPNFILPLNHCYLYGNVMSIIDSNNFRTLTEITDVYALYSLFFDYCDENYSGEFILNHPNKKLVLPATTLTSNCYSYMFNNCTSLTKVPELPATTLASSCYNSMFAGCTNLTEAPELPAITLASSCYSQMFYNCTSLTSAPELPATTLADACYGNMFGYCTSLTTTSELPATTLASGCYRSMFFGCTSLTEAPALPATELADHCYYGMFYGCTSLTSAPELPATALTSSCYQFMFRDCTSLTEAPELPATTLASYCYYYMFEGCTSLTTTPELPATTLVTGCYYSMFRDCASLTSAPELPATVLTSGCYQNMFYGCSSLNYIKCLAVNGINQNSSTFYWVQGVQTNSGTFIKHPDATDWPTGDNGIPANWTVEDAV